MCTSFCVDIVLISFEYIVKSRIAGSYSNCFFVCFRNCQTNFQCGCTILQYYQQCMSFQFLYILVNTCYHLKFFIIAILVCVKWYLVEVLIFIFLIANNILHIIMCLLFYIFFGVSIQTLGLFFYQDFCLPNMEF